MKTNHPSGRSCRASLAAICQQPGQQIGPATPRGGRRCVRRSTRRRAAWPISAARPGVSVRMASATSVPSRATRTSLPGVREHLDTLPGVGQQAGAGAGRLEYSRGGRKAGRRHAVAADVQHRQGADVQGVVADRSARAPASSRWPGTLCLPNPSRRAETAGPAGPHSRRQEKIVDPLLAIGQAVSEEGQVGPRSDASAGTGWWV